MLLCRRWGSKGRFSVVEDSARAWPLGGVGWDPSSAAPTKEARDPSRPVSCFTGSSGEEQGRGEEWRARIEHGETRLLSVLIPLPLHTRKTAG